MKNTKQMIEVMQAFVDGKKIECKCMDITDDEWEDSETPAWTWSSFDYRIKPEPQYRPWKAEEVPVGKVIVHKASRNKFLLHSLIHKNLAGDYNVMIGTTECSMETIFAAFMMEDGSPCGVKVE